MGGGCCLAIGDWPGLAKEKDCEGAWLGLLIGLGGFCAVVEPLGFSRSFGDQYCCELMMKVIYRVRRY